jgi:hypothetical protein
VGQGTRGERRNIIFSVHNEPMTGYWKWEIRVIGMYDFMTENISSAVDSTPRDRLKVKKGTTNIKQ